MVNKWCGRAGLRLAVVVVVLAAGLLALPQHAAASGFYGGPSGWTFRSTVNVSNSGNVSLANGQVPFIVNTQSLISSGKLRADCADIRVAKMDGTVIPHWIESGCNTTSTYVWANVPSVPSGGSSIRLYYGNPSASNTSSLSVFNSGALFAHVGNCSVTLCQYTDNHTEAESLRGSLADLCSITVTKIDWGYPCTSQPLGTNTRDLFFSWFHVLFLPDTSGSWTFGLYGDDAGEVTLSKADHALGAAETILVSGYGSCGICTERTGTFSLTSGSAVWLDVLTSEGTGFEGSRLRLARPGGSLAILNTTNFPGLIYTRAYGNGAVSGSVVGPEEQLPSVVQGPSAAGGYNSITTSWSPPASSGSAALTGYFVISHSGSASGPIVGQYNLTTSSQSLTESGLADRETRWYDIAAASSVGRGPSTIVSATTYGAPSAPYIYQAVGGNHSGTFSWFAPSDDGGLPLTAYYVYVGTTSGGEVYTTATAPSNPSVTLALTNGTTYYVQVTASNSYREGPRSNEVSLTPTTVPDPPANVAASAGAGSVSLSWSAGFNGGSNITDFKIYAGTSSAAESFLASTGSGANTSFVANGLAYDVTMFFNITAVNARGESVSSNEVSATPRCPGPVNDCFSSATVLASSPYSATINTTGASLQSGEPRPCGFVGSTLWYAWTAPASGTATVSTVSPITAYDTVLAAYTGKYLTSLTSLACNDDFPGAGTQSQITFACTAGSSYFLQLGGFNSASGVAALSINGCGIPAAPNAPTLTPGNHTLNASWTAGSGAPGSPPTNYRLYLGTVPGGETFLAETGGTNTSFTINALTNDTKYYIDITAVNAAGESAHSGETGGSPAGIPDPPASFVGVVGNHTATFSWNAPYDGTSPVSSYHLEICGDPGTGYVCSPVDTTLLSYVATGLNNGTSYSVNVTAKNAIGPSNAANIASIVPAGLPDPPAGLTLTRLDDALQLDWTLGQTGGPPLLSQSVFMGSASGAETFLGTVSGSATRFTAGSLTAGQLYYFRVNATNAVGMGNASNEASARAAHKASAPTLTQASLGDRQIALAWNAPVDAGGEPLSAYRIYRGTTSGGETLLDSIGTNTTYVAGGLTNGQTYFFKVSAVTSFAEGFLSNELSQHPAAPPSAPVSLEATRGDRQVSLSWTPPASNNGDPVSGYVLYRGTTSGAEAQFDSIGTNMTYVATGLTNGVTYYFQVAAQNLAGLGPRAAEVSAIPATLPLAPTGLTATPGNHTVRLDWTPSANGGSALTGYHIWMGSASGSATLLAATGSGANTSFTVNGLPNGAARFFNVTALNAVGEGASSAEVSATARTIPEPPAGLSITRLVGGALRLDWALGADGGSALTAHKVYLGTATGQESLLATIGPANTSFTANGLTLGTVYYFKVNATNVVGESNSTVEASARAATSPDAPLALVATMDDRQLRLTWNAPPATGGEPLTQYRIFRSTVSGAETLLDSIGTNTSYVAAGLVNGQTYYFMVSAVTSFGEGARSLEASQHPAAPPSAPTSLLATRGNGQVTLTWALPATNNGDPVSGYSIYSGAASGGESLLDSIGANTSYVVTGLTNGQTYFFQVAASNAAGLGARAAEVRAVPATTPSSPQGLVVTRGDHQLSLSWNPPSSTGGDPLTGYVILVGASSGTETLRDTIGTNTSYVIAGLANGVRQFVQVAALNSVGQGVSSSESSGVPAGVPFPPVAPTATRADRQVTLAWNASTDNNGDSITGYAVYVDNVRRDSIGLNRSYVVAGLTNGQTYAFSISALNGVGEGALSVATNAKPATTPTAARSLTASRGDHLVHLSWLAPLNDGGESVTQYRIMNTATGYVDTIGANTSYDVTGLTNGFNYSFQVVSGTIVGNGPASNTANATPSGLPFAPTLSATPAAASIALSWTTPEANGAPITNYGIYLSTSPGTETIVAATQGTNTSFVVHNLVNGRTYYVVVRAINLVGQGLASNEQVVTPLAPPSAPRSLTASNFGTNVTLTWVAPATNGGTAVQQYRIYMATTPSGERSLLTTVGNVTSWNDPAPPGAVRTYNVSAVNVVGEGPLSAQAQGSTAPGPATPTTADTYRTCTVAPGAPPACTAGSTHTVTQVAAGARHTCILLSDARVDCYGDNSDGQAGDSLLGRALQISTGATHTCVLLNTRSVDCYGDNAWGKATSYLAPGPVANDAMEVAAGGSHTCFLLRSGAVICEGSAFYGQTAGVASGALHVATGAFHTCVLLSTGDVTCSGLNDRGQTAGYLGHRAIAVAAGGASSCALLDNASVTCWGQLAAQTPNLTNAVQVVVGKDHACARLQGGSVTCWGSDRYGQRSVPTTLTDATDISAGESDTCILHVNGTVTCVGTDPRADYGQTQSYPSV